MILDLMAWRDGMEMSDPQELLDLGALKSAAQSNGDAAAGCQGGIRIG
jgi:hypothetical protein